jgi:hypothetical protein
MVDFKKLAQQAKTAVDKRGGTESLKEDFAELKGIAKGKGSLSDKAKEAAAVIKQPGSTDPAASSTPAPSPGADAAKKPVPDPDAPGSEQHGGRHAGGHGRHGDKLQ